MSLPAERLHHHRHQGHRGGVIPMHRALNHLEIRTARVVGSVALVLVVVALWATLWPVVVGLWADIGRIALEILGVPGTVEVVTRDFVAGLTLDVPRYAVPATVPGPVQWYVGLGVTAVLLIVPMFLPDDWRPIAYLMRLLAAVQISSQLVFSLFPTAFPYDIGGMTETSLLANLFVIGLVPLIMGFAFFPLSYGWRHRIASFLWPMLHLTLAVPLLYVAHAWIIHHGSLLWMPLLFWAFGLVITVFTVVTFYGWAASWTPQDTGPRRRRRRPRPTWESLVIALVVVLPASAHADELVESVQAGADVGSYSEDLGTAWSSFVAYTAERPWKDRWRFEAGLASRFDDTGLGLGASYGFHLTRDRFLSAGLSTGTGDVILPEWRFDVGLRQTGWLRDRLVVDVGYTHIQSKAENTTDGVGAGLLYALGRGFQVGVDGRVDRGNPGSTTGTSIAGSLQYGIYRKFYASVRVEAGRIAYLLIGPTDLLAEYDSRGLRAGVTWYVRPTRGVALEFNRMDTDFYDFTSIGLRAFTEW